MKFRLSHGDHNSRDKIIILNDLGIVGLYQTTRMETTTKRERSAWLMGLMYTSRADI